MNLTLRESATRPPPPSPRFTSRLGFTIQTKLVRQIEELVMILPSFPRSFRLIH